MLPIVNTLRGGYTDTDRHTQSHIPTLQTKPILRNQEQLLANNIVSNAVILSNMIYNCGIHFYLLFQHGGSMYAL